MKISAIEQSAQNTFEVIIAQEGEKKVGFTVVGPGSEQYAAADREIQIMNIKEAAMRKTGLDMTKDADAAVVADGAENRRWSTLSRCVVGWFGFVNDDDTPAEFSPDALKRVLKARPYWATMVLAAIDDERNFTLG